MELPPQPDPGDFDAGYGIRPQYLDALAAWERVCQAIIAAESVSSVAAPAEK